MNKILTTAATILLFSGPIAQAELLKTKQGAKRLEEVTLAETGEIQSAGKAVTLTSVGAGLRTKKVVMVNVKVYVGELFVAQPTAFKKSEAEALKSLNDAQPVAIRLTFLRSVDGEKVQSSFKEALEANKIDTKKQEIAKFLEFVKNGGEAKQGKSITIVGIKKTPGPDIIHYEDSNGKENTVVGTGLIDEIFAIWLGKPADSGVEKLKTELLK